MSTATAQPGALRPKLEEAIARFNERAKNDPKMQENLKDYNRKVQLDIEGDQTYHFYLHDLQIDKLEDGPIEQPEVTVSSDRETLLGIMNGEISPLRAYAAKKIKFKATLMDLLLLKKLF